MPDLQPHTDGEQHGLRGQQLPPLRGEHHRQVHLSPVIHSALCVVLSLKYIFPDPTLCVFL